MKRAVGIGFGHDAGIAVVSELGIEKYYSKERLSRCKAAYGWDIDTLSEVLKDHYSVPIGISTTQDRRAPIVGGRGRLFLESTSPQFTYDPVFPDHLPFIPSGRFGWMKSSDRQSICDVMISETWDSQIKRYGHLRHTLGVRNLKQLTAINGADIEAVVERYLDSNASGFVGMPECNFTLDGTSFHAYVLMHHLSHATYAFWASGLENALVISYDGGTSVNWGGGGYFWGSAQEGVQPLLPGGFWMGKLYDSTAQAVGVGEAGKLMGLAPYGQPRFYTADLIGSISDIEARFGYELNLIIDTWHRETCGINAPLKWDTNSLNCPQVAVDAAASVQKILEDNILNNVKTGLDIMAALNRPVDGIVLVGGGALNCPANSRVHQAYPELKVFVPPACNDEGLALGNAVATYFKAYDAFPPRAQTEYEGVYLGKEYSPDEIRVAVSALTKVSDFVPDNVAKFINDGAIVGIFHGRSEIGPRALGHRSILASPLIAENWAKVNKVKNREPWRPFAPICLESEMATHFEGSDLKSRFMLFTHRVKHDALPAITHRDRSARAQAANADCGPVFEILTAFKQLTGYGVLLNTSFNGKDVPIVETPSEAVAEAQRIGLDYLVCDQGIFKI